MAVLHPVVKRINARHRNRMSLIRIMVSRKMKKKAAAMEA